MNKDESIKSVIKFVNQIKAKDKFCDESYDFVNGWKLEIEYYPSDGVKQTEIYFDSIKEGVDVDDWEHDCWYGDESEDTLYSIIEYMYNCAVDYEPNETTV